MVVMKNVSVSMWLMKGNVDNVLTTRLSRKEGRKVFHQPHVQDEVGQNILFLSSIPSSSFYPHVDRKGSSVIVKGDLF
jgi:hypothetical protein